MGCHRQARSRGIRRSYQVHYMVYRARCCPINVIVYPHLVGLETGAILLLGGVRAPRPNREGYLPPDSMYNVFNEARKTTIRQMSRSLEFARKYYGQSYGQDARQLTRPNYRGDYCSTALLLRECNDGRESPLG